MESQLVKIITLYQKASYRPTYLRLRMKPHDYSTNSNHFHYAPTSTAATQAYNALSREGIDPSFPVMP